MILLKKNSAKLLWLLVSLLCVACERAAWSDAEQDPLGGEPREVRVAVPAPESRTELEENGVVVRWSSDDRIALWATDGTNWPLSAQSFALWCYSEEYPTAYFTATIPPMAENTYTYYGAYPLPSSVAGTVATYDLPAEQDGTPVLKNAVLVARPVVSGALSFDADQTHLHFVQKLHVLKITIPETKNLLGEPLTSVQLTFPVAVTGRLTVDVTDPDLPVSLSEGSEVLTLNFPEPVEAGTTVYAVIAPVDASEGMITFRGYSATRESEAISARGKNFQAGHTTPIRLTIPALRKITRLFFSLGDNFLGENPNSFTISVNGGTFPDGSSSKSFAVNTENRYEVSYEGEFTDNFSGKTLTYAFDSDNALVSSTSAAMPSIEAYARNTMPSMDVPYLFYEDFSTVSSFERDYLGGPYTSTSGATTSGYDLSQYGLRSGWTGARTGGDAGHSVLVGGRVDEVSVLMVSGATRAYGRLDSPAMSGLKAGKSVNVVVKFNYSGGCDDSDDTYYPVAAFGYTTTTGTIGGYATQYEDATQFANISGHTEITNISKSGSWTSIPQEATYTIANCANNYRLSWHVVSMGKKGSLWTTVGINHWMYLDNIRVSIAAQ